MLTRIISAIIGGGVFLGVCFCGLLPSTIGITVLTAVAIIEFNRGYAKAFTALPADSSTPPPSKINALITWIGVLFPWFTYSALQSQPARVDRIALLLGILVLVLALRLRRPLRDEGVLGRLTYSYGLVGMAYLGLLFSSFVLLRGLPGRLQLTPLPEIDRGAWLMVFTATAVWATDSFAYFVGKAYGKRPFAPRISPAKTWEGFLGGLAGGLVAGLLFAQGIHVSLLHGAVVGLIAGVFGPLGDLFESALKRELNLKDFGSIMPGHGGILDRFDSLLFVTPLIYLYLHFVAKIG
jgi:phosphatidate cytidylyltransferase